MPTTIKVHDGVKGKGKIKSRKKHVNESGLLVELFRYQVANFFGETFQQVNLSGPILLEAVKNKKGFRALVMPIFRRVDASAVKDAARRLRAVEHVRENHPDVWEEAMEAAGKRSF